MDKKALREKFERQFSGLKKIYIKHDPFALVENGAPENEHDSEIAKILSGLKSAKSESDTVQLINRVMKDSYDETGSNEEFAKEVYAWWISLGNEQ